MATILPEVAPRRGSFAAVRSVLPGVRTAFLVLLVLLVGTAGAVGARAWTSREAALPGPDKPRGRHLPLVTTASLPAGPYNPAFTIDLPENPRVLQAPTTPGGMILSVRLTPASPVGALLFTRIEGATDARASLLGLGAGLYSVGPMRTTSVGGVVAYTRDMPVGTSVLHEYHFSYEGVVYAVGIMTAASNPVAYDTGLAALATLRFG